MKSQDQELPVGQVIEDELTEDSDSEVIKHKKVQNVIASEAYGNEPLEDKLGRDLWIRTRQCSCPDDLITDCRFHSQTEPGWEVCPNLALAKKDKTMKTRWLWARNPRYGKPPTEQEQAEYDERKAAAELKLAA